MGVHDLKHNGAHDATRPQALFQLDNLLLQFTRAFVAIDIHGRPGATSQLLQVVRRPRMLVSATLSNAIVSAEQPFATHAFFALTRNGKIIRYASPQ
jgi:hypothetical protein